MQVSQQNSNRKAVRKISTDKQSALSSAQKTRVTHKTESKNQGKDKQQKIQECLLHSKPADLICVADGSIICCNCALFGSHKGHEIIDCDGLLRDLTQTTQICLDLYDQIQQCWKQNGKKTLSGKSKKIIENKKIKLKDEINLYYDQLLQNIRQEQNRNLSQVQKWYESQAAKLQGVIAEQQENQVEEEYLGWQQSLNNLAKILEIKPTNTQNIEKLSAGLQYIEKQTSRSQHRYKLQSRGSYLMDWRSKRTNTIIADITERIQNVKVQTRPLDLENCCQFITSKIHSTNLETLNGQGERNQDLLISVSHHENPAHYPVSIIPPKSKQKVVCIAEQTYFQNIPHLSISDICSNAHLNSNLSSDRSFIALQEKQTNRQHDKKMKIKEESSQKYLKSYKTEESMDTDACKKKKKHMLSISEMHIDEKFKGTLEDLKYNRAQTIDLTNAEIQDSHIWSISYYLGRSDRVKLVKLIKNRLTDSCLPQIIRSILNRQCKNQISLNLSQNSFTDKSLLLIEKQLLNCTKQGCSIKSITLSMNKINRRNMKAKIDEIGNKWGVTLIV